MKLKKLIATVLMLTVLTGMFAGCGTNGDASNSNNSVTESDNTASGNDASLDSASKTETSNGASNWVWAEIKENVTKDMETNPKDDFHLYVNKEWILNNELPDGYVLYSKYAERQLDVDKEFIAILQDDSLDSNLAKDVQGMYRTILDWDTRNELGYVPLEADLEVIENIENIDDFYAFISEKNAYNDALFGYYVYSDLDDASVNIFFMSQNDLLLDDAAEYSEMTSNGQLEYDVYLALLEYMLPNLGKSKEDAKVMLDSAIEFEKKLAAKAYTVEDMYSDDYYDRTNNKMTVEEVCALCPDYPMLDVLKAMGMDKVDAICVENPDYISELDDVIKEENLEAIKNLYEVKLICSSYSQLDENTYRECRKLINNLYGIDGVVSDEQMAAKAVKAIMPIQSQQLYVEVYGSEEKRELVTKICEQVIEAYSDMLKENDYLSQETIDKAVEKLHAIRINSLYPDKWPDVSACKLTGLSYYDAISEYNTFYTKYSLNKVGKPVDNDMWVDLDGGISILDCNAFYDPSNNSIYMIFGMMGEPFYSDDMSVEGIYASLGAFWIGHEISHAFDSSGSQFDKDGNYCDWWTEEDRAAFDERINKVDEYLSSINIDEDYYVNGIYVDTEMVADYTGIQCALRMAKDVEGFDYKKFFEIYGEMNVSIATKEIELNQLLTDSHPLDYLRTNIPVQQFEEFYKAFDVKEGDGMYLAPEDRLLVW